MVVLFILELLRIQTLRWVVYDKRAIVLVPCTVKGIANADFASCVSKYAILYLPHSSSYIQK